MLILTHAENAAYNALNVARSYLEGELLLAVKEQKCHVVHYFKGVKYLGVEIHPSYTRIKREKVREFKDKVKEITRCNTVILLVNYALSSSYLRVEGLFEMDAIQTGYLPQSC